MEAVVLKESGGNGVRVSHFEATGSLEASRFQFKDLEPARALVESFQVDFKRIEEAVGQVVIGMRPELRLAIATLFMGGHALMEGSPGLAKTLMINSIATAVGLKFQRIQFTPDLMPTDITGSLVQRADREFTFRQGPLFSNVILADEINRTGPKTQSALLEAMQEKQVTYDGKTYRLPRPFVVLATQNPLESAGTYPIPDAQLDRFVIKIQVQDPSIENLKTIMRLTTSSIEPKVRPVFASLEAEKVIEKYREVVKSVAVSEEIYDAVAQLTAALNPRHPERVPISLVDECVLAGPSPRGAQAVILLAKVFALLDGRGHVQMEDVEKAAHPALDHRIVIKPERLGEEEITPQRILDEAWGKVLSKKK